MAYHTQTHAHTETQIPFFGSLALKNQWGYLIKKQVCLWTHFRQSKCSTTTYPYYPQPPPTPTAPPPPPKPTINNGIERSLFILQPYTYSKTLTHIFLHISSTSTPDFFQTFTTGFLFYKMIKIRGNNPILTLKHNIFLHISLTSTPISFKPL